MWDVPLYWCSSFLIKYYMHIVINPSRILCLVMQERNYFYYYDCWHEGIYYQPQSRGDNTFGSISVFVCVHVCPSSPVWTVWATHSRGERQPMPFVCLFWWCNVWEICIIHLVASIRLSVFWRSHTWTVFLLARSGRYWYLALESTAKAQWTQVSYTLKNIIECSSEGAFKMAGRSKWLLFRQVAPSQSITLLIYNTSGKSCRGTSVQDLVWKQDSGWAFLPSHN